MEPPEDSQPTSSIHLLKVHAHCVPRHKALLLFRWCLPPISVCALGTTSLKTLTEIKCKEGEEKTLGGTILDTGLTEGTYPQRTFHLLLCCDQRGRGCKTRQTLVLVPILLLNCYLSNSEEVTSLNSNLLYIIVNTLQVIRVKWLRETSL
jgi:hypothetical protein